MNDAQTVTVTEAVYSFASDTHDRLIDLLLRLCSSDPSTAMEQPWFVNQLDKLTGDDDNFARWMAVNPISERSLLESLISDKSFGCESAAASRLRDLANAALRLQQLEKQFHAEVERRKRAAIYQLAYGLSHELNNPLANIATRAAVLLSGEESIERRQLLESIVDNSMRGSEMIGDLMLVARPPRIEPRTVHIPTWLNEILLQASKFAGDVRVTLMIQGIAADETAEFDPVAMKELIWCLLRNAIEASPADAEIQFDVQRQDERLTMKISDSGQGLSEDAQAHCFDLYYSGREAGRGLGMGLAKAALIAELHAAELSVSNRAGNGCVASLSFKLPVTRRTTAPA
jgi:signal transduction histidine kinase